MFKSWSKTQAEVGYKLSRSRTGYRSEGESRCSRNDVIVDVGEIPQGHVMGDASAAIRIMRRMGLGKVRQANTNWLWVQEKEASREVQYRKLTGSDNSADLLTKALDHDSSVRHTEAVGCEFVFGRDPIAFTVNNPSAKLSIEGVPQEMGHRFKASGREAKPARPQRGDDRIGETLHTE